MSMTDFMALVLSWGIEARKFPAAPALWVVKDYQSALPEVYIE